jgi:hypothetical protein
MAGHIAMMSAAEALKLTLPFDIVTKDPSALHAVMEKFGCALVSDVVSKEECAALERLWEEDLTSIISHDDSNPAAVAALTKNVVHNWNLNTMPLGRSSALNYGLPHGKLAWTVRLHKNVKSVYSALYNGESDLCVGTDAVFFENRPLMKPEAEIKESLWPHVDHNVHLGSEAEWDEYQSVLYVWPTDESTSTTVVWPESHSSSNKTCPPHINNGHFVPLAPELHDEFAAHSRRARVPAGAMFIWNSRTVHQGWSHGPRLAVPVCFEPKGRRTDEALQRKITFAMQGRPTTHWASLGILHSVFGSHTAAATEPGITLAHRAHHHVKQEVSLDIKPEIFDLL